MEHVSRGAQLIRHAANHPRMALTRALEGRERFIAAPIDRMMRDCPSPDLIVEAGAADGTDTVRLAQAFPQARIVALEPLGDAYRRCLDRTRGWAKVEVRQCALAREDGFVLLYPATDDVTGVTDSSSVLKPTGHTKHFPTVRFDTPIEVRAMNLDTIATSISRSSSLLLWLDLQGLELEVLSSSHVGRDLASVVYMEVSRVPLFDGAPTYKQVKKAMKLWGYAETFSRVGRVSGNVLFVRK